MALWSFSGPIGLTIPFERKPIFSVWTRVKVNVGSTVVQNSDATWTQYDGFAPETFVNAINGEFFGRRGFSGGTLGTVTSAQMGFFQPLRVYLGGRNYIITDAMKAELLAAVTPQQPTGYAAFIAPAPASAKPVGDEIILSGKYESEYPKAP
jgi:hypothetical protein